MCIRDRDKKKDEVKERSDGNKTSAITSAKSGGIDHSSISFSLLGRSAIDIPNPVYTCDRSGKIVINISVNAEGRVTSASVNKAVHQLPTNVWPTRHLNMQLRPFLAVCPAAIHNPGQ